MKQNFNAREPKFITSADNLEIKHIVKLHSTKTRKEFRQFIAEGFRAIETIAKRFEIKKLFVIQENFILAQDKFETEATVVTPALMAKMSSAITPSGILALFDIPQYEQKIIDSALVLAQISDPGNMGTLLRTAAACNVKTAIIVEGTDPWSPKVVQASAGTIANLNILQITWEKLLEIKSNYKLCALVVTGGNQPQNLDLSKSLLVIGNEAHGLPQDWIDSCEQKLTLPMPGGTESLNAAVAGSIAIYLSKVTGCDISI